MWFKTEKLQKQCGCKALLTQKQTPSIRFYLKPNKLHCNYVSKSKSPKPLLIKRVQSSYSRVLYPGYSWIVYNFFRNLISVGNIDQREWVSKFVFGWLNDCCYFVWIVPCGGLLQKRRPLQKNKESVPNVNKKRLYLALNL